MRRLSIIILSLILLGASFGFVLASPGPASRSQQIIDCRPDGTGCPRGASQSFPFSMPNWLKDGPRDIAQLFDMLARWILNISVPIAVALIIYAGILYMLGGARPNNVTKAQNILKNVAIGLAIIFVGKGFISLIRSILETATR